MNIIPVIMCGGSGTRLWPLSRKSYPKQFLPLVSKYSLFQDTVLRSQAITQAPPIIVTNNDYRFLVAEQLSQCGVDKNDIILEPSSRNTAPAIAAAAVRALQNNSKNSTPLLLVLPADHSIKNPEKFVASVKLAAESAKNGKLVTFGITPTRPETGYGYIKTDSTSKKIPKSVEQFIEKPPTEKAEEFFESNEYFWNSGMFLFRADTFLEELEKFNPEMKSACEQAVENGSPDLDFFRLEGESFLASPEDSIDYAVMEKSEKVVVVPMNAEWNDVGSWSSLAETNQNDEFGNTCSGDTVLLDTQNCVVHSSKRTVATLGVKDLNIIETPDAILVSHKSRSQDVKSVVDALKARNNDIATAHKLTYRPWGNYDSIDTGKRFQVKRITVKPGEVLSLQKHFHRSEHWIVVSGVAEVTCGEQVFIKSENESAYIPRGAVHRLSNPGKIPLELIEVQSGSYLGEDDIVRIEDNYGRNNNITPISNRKLTA